MAAVFQTELRHSAKFLAEFSRTQLTEYFNLIREIVCRGQQTGVFRRGISDKIVANLSPVRPGDTYDREKVTLYTRRLLESGYFASVQAEIDAQPAAADASPLRVAVIEAPKHHFEAGVGYNTNQARIAIGHSTIEVQSQVPLQPSRQVRVMTSQR